MKASKNLAKQRALHKEKVIKKRIEMLLTSATIGLVAGVIIGIVLPIGGVKKSEYKKKTPCVVFFIRCYANSQRNNHPKMSNLHLYKG